MLLSSEKKFIFVHVPKTAGQSITRALAPFCDHSSKTLLRRFLSHIPVPENPAEAYLRTHDKAAWLRAKLPREIYDSYYKFAVVRNPYDHAVSYFAYLRQNQQSRRHSAAQRWNFADFLSYMKRKERLGGVLQSRWVTDRSGSLIVDELLRFEALNEQFPKLLEKLAIPPDTNLPSINRSDRSDYRDMYGPEERAIADRLFRRDLDLFGYDF